MPQMGPQLEQERRAARPRQALPTPPRDSRRHNPVSGAGIEFIGERNRGWLAAGRGRFPSSLGCSRHRESPVRPLVEDHPFFPSSIYGGTGR